MRRHFWMACLMSLASLPYLLQSLAYAQEPPLPATSEPIASQKVPTEKSPADSIQSRTIYVPYSDLNSTFEKPDTNVVIPYGEYRKLLEALRQGKTVPDAPVAVITTADYQVHVEGDLARIAAQLKVKVLRPGWSEIPLHFGAATIGSLKSAENVMLRGGPDNRNRLIFPDAGDYDVELHLAAPVHQSPEAREITFDCPAVALTTVRVTVPGKDQKIEVVPSSPSVPTAGETPDSTQLTATVGATGKISVKWRAADSQMPVMNLLASVNNRTLVTIGNGLIHTETWLTYDILRGELEQTRIALPRSARLLDVFADQGMANWTVAEEGENQIVTVKLPVAVKQQLQITVRTESKLPETEFAVAGLSAEKVAAGVHALDAVRESGQIAVRHSSDLTLNVVEQHGLVRIENEAADPKLAGPNAMLFKFYSPQVALRLSARPVEPRLQVEHAVDLLFQDDELQFINRLAYLVEQAGIFELKFKLPERTIIDQVDSPQMKEYSLDAATQQLTVSLRERTLGKIDLQIKGHLPHTATGTEELNLPILEPLNVAREQGVVRVFAGESLEVQAVPEGLEAAQPLPIGGGVSRENLRISSVWSFTHRPVVIPVRVVQQPARLRAQVGTLIDVEPERVHVAARVTFQIEYAAIDEFRIEVPEAVSSKVQIDVEPGNTTSAPIKQKNAGPVENGKVIWTVQTQRKVLGSQVFLISYDASAADLAPSTGTSETAPATKKTVTAQSEQAFHFDLIRPLGMADAAGEVTTPLAEFRGEVTLKKDRTLAVNATSTGNGVEQIDVRELTLLPQDGTLAFRYFRDDQENPVAVNVTSSRFDLQDVVATVVSRGLIEIVTSEDQSVTYRCRFRIKSSERQRLLVSLPQDLEVLGAFLNDREVKLEKADVPSISGVNKTLVPFWINVARTESSETPFLLTFQFLWNLKSGTTSHLLEESLLHLPLPVVAGGSQGVVQELKVVVWMPEEYALIGDPHPFLLQKRNRPFSVLLGKPADHQTSHLADWVTEGGSSAGTFAELPTQGRKAYVFSTLGQASEITARIWNKVWMTLLISVTLVVIGWILLATSWENKLGILLLLAFAGAIYGLYDSHGLAQGIHAARYGLVTVLLMWLLRGLFGAPRHESPPPKEYHSTSIPYAVIPPPGVFDRFHPETVHPESGGTA